MAKKFDTNPLDPEFPEKAAQMPQAETASKLTANTQMFGNSIVTEQRTQRFNDVQGYFETPDYQPPAVYQTSKLYAEPESANRKVAKIGLPENVMVALPYLPWGIGLIAGLIELLLVPKSETKVRFHAAQGLALHIGVLLISAIVGVVDNFSDWAAAGNGIFQLAMFVCFIYWTVKAFKGKPIHVESVDDLTNWLDEKVSLDKVTK